MAGLDHIVMTPAECDDVLDVVVSTGASTCNMVRVKHLDAGTVRVGQAPHAATVSLECGL